jgi:hypothetical protein
MRSFTNSIKIFMIQIFLFLLAQSAFSQKSFEGVIKYKVVDSGKTSYVKYYSVPKKVRIEVEDPKKDDEAVVIFNSRKDELTIILKSEKTAISLPMIKDDSKKNDDEKKEKKFNIKRTKDTKTIFGYNATKYIGTGKGDEIEIWVTDDIKPFVGFGGTTGDKLEIQDIAGLEISGFPLEFYNITKGSSIVVTSIEQKSLDESLFKAPSNYKQYNYKTFLKGLKTLTKDLSNFFKDLKLDVFSE